MGDNYINCTILIVHSPCVCVSYMHWHGKNFRIQTAYLNKAEVVRRYPVSHSPQKKRYRVNVKTRECQVSTLDHPFHTHDVPTGARFRGLYYLGSDAVEEV